jgi:hypothetical protein
MLPIAVALDSHFVPSLTLLISGYVAPKMQDKGVAWDFADLVRKAKPLRLSYGATWHMGFAKFNSRIA